MQLQATPLLLIHLGLKGLLGEQEVEANSKLVAVVAQGSMARFMSSYFALLWLLTHILMSRCTVWTR